MSCVLFLCDSNSLVDFEGNVSAALEKVLSQTSDYLIRSKAQEALSAMENYALERFFHRVFASEHRFASTFTEEQRWIVLELFLGDHAFDCVDVDGYVLHHLLVCRVAANRYRLIYHYSNSFLDLIVQDLRLENLQTNPREFNFRAAHRKLSLSHLKQLLHDEPALVQNSVTFAVRGVQLLQAADAEASKDVIDCRDAAQRGRELDCLTKYFDFLKDFSADVNCVRLVLLHRKLKLLQLQQWTSPSESELVQALLNYLQVPRVDALYMRTGVFASVPSEHVVNYSSEQYRTKLANVVGLGYTLVSQQSDRQLIEDALYALWRIVHSAEVESSLAQYLAADFLRTVKAQCMIRTGQGEVSEWSKHLPRHGSELADLSSTSELSFCESNPSYFSPDDDLAIRIRVRNVKRLTIHLYELRTIEYYSRVRKEIQCNINLDGLLPNVEQTIDLSHLSPFQEANIPVSFPQVKSKRGVYVVEVLEGNQTCRAILRKGFLRHVERITDAGHELLVFDEKGELLCDAKALVLNLKSGSSRSQPGRTYTANAESKLLIPFRHAGESGSGDKFAIAFCHEAFGFFHQTFKYLTDRVTLKADMHIDSEQLLSGSTAQLVVRPHLLLQDTSQELSLKSLTQVKLTVKFTKVGTSANGSEEVFEFSNMDEFLGKVQSFEIPMDTKSVSTTLSARVSKPGQDDYDSDGGKFASPTVSSGKTFLVQRVTSFPETYTPHLIRRPAPSAPSEAGNVDELSLLVLGHNGESMPNVKVTLACKCLHFVENVTVSLQSDSNGEIKLGQLRGVQQIQAHFPHSHGTETRWTWELSDIRSYQPRMVNCFVGESVEIPLPPAFRDQLATWLSKNQVGVYKATNLGSATPVLESAPRPHSSMEVVKNASGEAILLKVTVHTSGSFVLLLRPLNIKFPITVIANRNSDVPTPNGVLVQQKQLVLPVTSRPLTIISHEIKVEGEIQRPVLEVQLRNFSLESTKVIVTFKRFVDVQNSKISQVITSGGLAKVSKSGVRLPDWVFDVAFLENEYLKKRKISDEYKYILERRLVTQVNPRSLQFLGVSNLSKPSLLQNPHVLESTDMEEVVMGAGENVPSIQGAPAASDIYGTVLGRGGAHRRRSFAEPGIPSISFLGQTSQVVSASELSADGLVRIELNELDFFKSGAHGSSGTFEMIVLAVDYAHDQVCSSDAVMALTRSDPNPTSKIIKRDIRLSSDEALQQPAHYVQKQHHEVIHASEQCVLPRSSSTKYALYESIENAMNLWNTLCSNTQVRGLTDQLCQWSSMNLDAKLRFYYANASDDLNVFLSRKDTAFFDQFAMPLVQSKISKSLIDWYLLNDEATLRKLYLAPGVFQELSVIEKLLIAERLSSPADAAKICERVYLDIAGTSSSTTLRDLFGSVLSQGSIKPSEQVAPAPPACSPGGGGMPEMDGSFLSGSIGQAMPYPSKLPESSFFGAPSPPRQQSLSRQRSSFQTKKKSVAPSNELSFEEADFLDDNFGVDSVSSDDDDDGSDGENEDGDEFKKQNARKRNDTAYIPPGKVRMTQKKRFFDTQRPSLDGRNQFWKAFADHIFRTKSKTPERGKGFTSSFFPEALASSLNEGLLALAFLDLPMKTSIRSTEIRILSPAGNKVELSPRHDVILYHQNIEDGECDDDPNSKLILKQKIVSYDESPASNEPSAVLEFVVNTMYTCIVSASNVGSSELSGVNMLLQVPRGAIPLHKSSFYTKNHVFDVPANHSITKTVDFYFPEAGDFEQYPAQAAVDSKVVAWASVAPSIQVLLQPTQVDLTSWSDVSSRGSLSDVLGYLSAHKKMLSVDLFPLCWRCTDEAFYCGVTAFLRDKMVYQENLWKYAFMHNDAVGMRELLSSSTNLKQSVGLGLETSFFATTELYQYEHCINSIGKSFDHSEFGPFLYHRAHDVSSRVTTATTSSTAGARGLRILNKNARDFYLSLCQRLGQFATLDGQHLLVLTFFMLLFNRTEDALSLFARLRALPASKKAGIEGSVQFDYVDAYLDVFRISDDDQADFSVARRNVAKHKKHPQMRWRARFVRLGEFVAEYDHFEAQKSRQALQGLSLAEVDANSSGNDTSDLGLPLTKTLQVKLDATVADDKIQLTSQNLGKCELSFYPIDVEFMFSSKPFGTFSDSVASASSLLLIQPREQLIVTLDSSWSNGSGGAREEAEVVKTEVQIPQELQRQQMMVRVREQSESRLIETVTTPIDLMRSYFNSSLQVEVMKQSGILQVFHAGFPVARCYVKVYAKVSSRSGADAGTSGAKGKAQFYKDGYTDLLGKFDYVGINGDLIARVSKFSILVSHAKFGASVREADPPVLATTSGDFQHQEEHEMLLY